MRLTGTHKSNTLIPYHGQQSASSHQSKENLLGDQVSQRSRIQATRHSQLKLFHQAHVVPTLTRTKVITHHTRCGASKEQTSSHVHSRKATRIPNSSCRVLLTATAGVTAPPMQESADVLPRGVCDQLQRDRQRSKGLTRVDTGTARQKRRHSGDCTCCTDKADSLAAARKSGCARTLAKRPAPQKHVSTPAMSTCCTSCSYLLSSACSAPHAYCNWASAISL